MDLIEKYLKPLEKDAEKEKQMGLALKELRNQMVFSFLMINSIWCLTIFLLQENKDLVSLTFLLVPKSEDLFLILILKQLCIGIGIVLAS